MSTDTQVEPALGSEPDLDAPMQAGYATTWGEKKEFCKLEAKCYWLDDVPITENPYFENTWPWRWFSDEYDRLAG